MCSSDLILHHDYPLRVQADANFKPASLPVSAEHLRAEGLSNTFVEYMKTWKGFVKDNEGFIDNALILNS